MSGIKLLAGALSIAGLGFGAGYYCAADSVPVGAPVAANNTGQAALEAQLDETIGELRRLQAGRAAAPQTRAPSAETVAEEAYAELLEKIDKLPEPFIEAQLKKHLGPESLRKVSDPRAFSKRLLEVALDDQAPAAEDAEDDPVLAQVDIQFSKSPMYGKQMISQDVALAQFEPMFAHLVSSEELGDVIVKWQDVKTGEILIFRSMNIGAGGQQYVSAVPGTGWRNSVYRVSLSSMDDSVTLMGTNAYTVAQVYPADGTQGPNQEIIRDLISIGQAFPKAPQ